MYITVLGSTLAVSVIGIAALMAVRVERKTVEGGTDFAQARWYAESAVHIGRALIEADDGWRSTYPSGPWATDAPMGNGTYSLDGVDPVDGDPADDELDSLMLTGTGVQGIARYKLQAQLQAVARPLECLESALHSGASVFFSGATVNADMQISANDQISATVSAINADVEAVNSITGVGYTGTQTVGVAARAVPSSAVFDYYIANGTAINYAAIPGGKIQDVVLSLASNPYGGPVDPNGIYVVDCVLQKIHVENCRILGTLVLLDPSSDAKVHRSVFATAFVSDYPVLMVRGNFAIETDATPLAEPVRNVNFNPMATPYAGVQDTDTLDTYPSTISGLVYVAGDLAMKNTVSIDGLVVTGGVVTAQGSSTLSYSAAYYDNPPPGFRYPPEMVVVDGSWRWIVN